jgi:tetratricopeptide (TPR) repeat protein
VLSNFLKHIVQRPWRSHRVRRARKLFEAAMGRKDRGDYEGARRSLKHAIFLDPEHADAYRWLGVLLVREQDYAGAAAHMERALALHPEMADGWMDLGAVYYFQRDLNRAGASYRAAVSAAPESAPAHGNLGKVLKDAGRFDEALLHLRCAYEIDPWSEGVFRNLIITLVDLDSCEEALRVAEAHAARNPESYEAQLFLGFAHQKLHDPNNALRCYDMALEMRADDAELYYNRAIAYQDLGRMVEAFADYERTLEMRGDFPLAEFHRALAWLLTGDFERGWDGYEVRKLSGDYPRRTSDLPQWDGSPLAARTIAIRSEQGLGDEIMFSSMFSEVVSMAEECIIECEPRLAKLFRRSFPRATVYAATTDRSLPDEVASRSIDVEVAAGSLPRFLRQKSRGFPTHSGYLKADPERVAHWTRRLSQLGAGRKIGISWSGGVRKTRRPMRSIPLERWLPILRVPAVHFVSLQYTAEAAAEAGALSEHGLRIAHWQEAIDDLDETAALVCALDQVISVCTAVIHLGGALGRPVWVMAPYSPEWRYGFVGEKMPWYPSVKIFRQPTFGQWEPVIASVVAELQHLVCGSSTE